MHKSSITLQLPDSICHIGHADFAKTVETELAKNASLLWQTLSHHANARVIAGTEQFHINQFHQPGQQINLIITVYYETESIEGCSTNSRPSIAVARMLVGFDTRTADAKMQILD